MTLDKARKIMGTMAESMTDEQIQAILDCFSSLIEVGFQSFEKSRQNRTLCKGNIISHNSL